jgi:hypothetical protein
MRPFKQIICGGVPEFESHMPSQADGLWSVMRGGSFRLEERLECRCAADPACKLSVPKGGPANPWGGP